MLLIRYANKIDQIVDQSVIDELAKDTYLQIVKQYEHADLIKLIDDVEYCLLSS